MKTATLLDHQPEDEERMWVAAVCAGEARAFEYLMRRYNRRLYRAARSILRDDAEAEDALQEAYWKAYQAMPGFQFASSLSTWLTRIVINESLSRLRRSRRRPEVIPPIMVVSQEWASGQRFRIHEQLTHARDKVGQLDQRTDGFVRLRGRRFGDIGRFMGLHE